MKIQLQGFGGMAPRFSKRLLADTMAQIARDLRLDGDRIDPLALPAPVSVAGITPSVRSLYQHDGGWLHWPERRSVVASPIDQDIHDRLYMSVPGGYPRFRVTGGGEYRLGIPRPPSAPTGTPDTPVDSQSAESTLVAEAVYYRTTFVDTYGQEGPPSAPSIRVDRELDTPVTVTLPAQPAGEYNFSQGKVRIYRSNSGTSESAFQFVDEVAIGTVTYYDTVPGAELQEILPSSGWIGPPDDDTDLYPEGPLQGLIDAGNGILAGFSGNTVCLCEPYRFHAWPVDYRISIPAKVVGLARVPGGILVCTTGRPRMLLGTQPGAMLLQTIRSDAPCVSAESIVETDGGVYYASTDGLILVQEMDAMNVTAPIFRKEDWAALNPAEITGGTYEGRYIGFNGADSFMFDLQGGRNAFIQLSSMPNGPETAVYSDLATGELYYAAGQTNVLFQWEAGSNVANYVWRSKEFHFPEPERFAVWAIDADEWPVVLNIYDNETLKFTVTASTSIGRLPNIRMQNITLEVVGVQPVNAIAIATSRGEVK